MERTSQDEWLARACQIHATAVMNITRKALHKKRGQSLRSRRKHKAWGASPRKQKQIELRAHEMGDSSGFIYDWSVAHFMGSQFFLILILGLAPQALCFRLLRRLRTLPQRWTILLFSYQGRRAPLRFALPPCFHIPHLWRYVSDFLHALQSSNRSLQKRLSLQTDAVSYRRC